MGSLIGPTDPEGPAGPQGIQGEAGTVGTIIASYETEADFRTDHPTGNKGDMYLVGTDLFIWDESRNDWVNVGPISGPQGIQGEQGQSGVNGESAYQIAVDGGFVGSKPNGCRVWLAPPAPQERLILERLSLA